MTDAIPTPTPLPIIVSEQEFKQRVDNGDELCCKCWSWLERHDEDIGCDVCGAPEDEIISPGWAIECEALIVLSRHMPQDALTDPVKLSKLRRELALRQLAEDIE